MILAYDDNFVYVEEPDAKQKHMLQVYHNAVFSKRHGWRLPKTVYAMRDLLRTFPELRQSTEFLSHGKALRDEMDRRLHDRSTILYFDHSQRLRGYQAHDVAILMGLPQAGVFNEPRTGKTPTIITLLRELGLKRNLVVAPASLIYNWQAEFKTWWPEADVCMYAGSPQARMKSLNRFDVTKSPAVLIISKDMLKLWKESPHFDTCVVDEAHFLRNYKTAQSEAVFKIKAERRYALTGTPTVKHPSDIYGILHFLEPKKYTSFWQFADRYFDAEQNIFSQGKVVGDPKPHRVQELQELIGLMSVQRKRKEVMPWLPEKERITMRCQMEPKQKKLYDDMRKHFMAELDGHEVDTSNVITQLIRMRQLLLDPRLLGFEVVGAKTKVLLEQLSENANPVVIMVWHSSYFKILKPELEKIGRKVGVIDGSVSPSEKARVASAFQAGNLDVLLCNIISAGTGFTLDRSQTVIFLEKAWNPSENEQAEDRICPTSQEKNHRHVIESYVCFGTLDDKMESVLANKQTLTEYINQGGSDAIRRLLS